MASRKKSSMRCRMVHQTMDLPATRDFDVHWGTFLSARESHCNMIHKTLKSLTGVTNLMHCEPLKASLIFAVNNRFSDYDCNRNVLATMLHPAFKRDYVVKNIQSADVELVVSRILYAMEQIPTITQGSADPSSTQSEKLRHLSMFFDDAEMSAAQHVSSNKEILDDYFSENDKSLEVLLKPKYAKLKDLYIEYNTQLLSSASSERLF